ncbi:DUF4143 domain-containing protein, partial [Frankia sp. CiP1_Cm_nod2]
MPAVLGAVKRAVDDDPRPGRFLLTGSVEADFTTRQWPGTGRVVRLVLHGLTEREITRSIDQPGLLDLLLGPDISRLSIAGTPPSLDDYVDLALRSGFPEAALNLSAPARLAWLDAYVDHVVTRDVLAVGEQRDPVRLHHLRSRDGQEVDVVIDLGGGQVIAIEIRASSVPTVRDARHLGWLRDHLGQDFRAGVVFHTGPMPFELG